MLVLAGCGTKFLPLAYTALASLVHGSALVRIGASVDQRRDNDPTWYGAIRGGYGNPLTVLRFDGPVSLCLRLDKTEISFRAFACSAIVSMNLRRKKVS